MKTIHYSLLLIVSGLLLGTHASSPNAFVIEGMQVEWAYQGDELTFKLHSPYQGWVALGFNERNAIVHTHLVMGAVTDDNTAMEEFYVLGFGNPQPLTKLGGDPSVTQFAGQENSTGTALTFTLDVTAQDDEYHYNLREGSEIWLICAYSMEDDFGHHSIMRRHLKVQL